MKKSYLMIAGMAIIAAVGLTSCSSSKPVANNNPQYTYTAPPQSAPAPTPVTAKPVTGNSEPEIEIVLPCSEIDSDLEYLRTNGYGKSVDRQMARDAAYLDALSRLSTKLEAVTATSTKSAAVSTSSGSADTGMSEAEATRKTVNVAKNIAKANTSGYRTACEKFTKQGNSYNCYVVIEYGKKVIVKQLFTALSQDKVLKADYNYDKYMQEFEKDLKEYEESKK
jgi:hypothetical protein